MRMTASWFSSQQSPPDTSLWRDVRAFLANSPRTVGCQQPLVIERQPDRRPSHTGNVTVTFDNGDQYSQTSHPRGTTDRGPAAGATPCQAAPADLPTARRAGAASPATPLALGSSGG